MYLSRLDLHGFKSFAQKTSVDFSPGVTAIVGPNGCGKSNVIDAVRWVLGEQRARLLRSEAMSGVIFNGAKGKRPLGMAEVSLTVENTRGVLPTEFSEVTITRRLYRSGDSEYLLNGTVCRLRDILDLFMDTGMGAGAYSVIELKMVEDILSDNADDRRRLFEEAAGVTKYKRRRAQALRRLDATQTDLTRLDDIIEEVEKQVRSLARQAQKASRHARLAGRLRQLELALAAHDFAALQTEREALEGQASERRDEAGGLGAQIATAEADLERARTDLVRLESEMAAAARTLNAHVETVRGLEADLRLGAERQTFNRRALDRLAAESDADAARRDTLLAEAEAAQTTLDAARQAAETARAALDAATERRDEATRQAQSARDALATARADADAARRAGRDAEAARDRARDRRELRAAEIARIEADLATLDRSEAEKLDDLRSREAEADTALAETGAHLDAARRRADAARDALDAARSAVRDAQSARDAAHAELDLLRSLAASGDGTDGGAAYLLEHDAGHVAVADVVACDDADRLALDAALGSLASALIVETDADLDAAVARLQEADAGRATFVVLDRLPATPATSSKAPTGTVRLLDRVRVAGDRYHPLVDRLLHDALLVETLDAALAFRAKAPSARFVTPEGARSDAPGIVYAGSATASGPTQRLGGRERIQAAEARLEEAETALTDALTALDAAEAARTDAEVTRADAETAREQARDIRDAARDAAARLEARTAALDDQIRRLQQRADELAEASHSEPDDDALAAAVEDAARVADQAEMARVEAEAAFDAADAARREAEGTWADARLTHAQAATEVAARQAGLDRNAQAQKDLDAREASREAESRRLRDELEAAQGSEGDLQTRLDAERQKTDALQTAASDAETAVLQARARIADVEASLRTVRSARETALQSQSSAELRLAEIGTRQDTILERLADEHGVDLDEADAERERLQAEELFQPDTARLEVPRLRDKIRDLGAVNALALESFEEEKERLAFLQEQRSDLADAETSLLDTIDEINATARARFDETFSAVRDAFQKLFNDLFGGDAAADLTLDGEDPLEAPVAIMARPRGKRPVSLTQLSGGEKTLTATALLFAIYLVKPSPFCILDEVDAPLDDANVGRFMTLIRSFADTTQFILVTHNKLTMEAADRMYGVTMPTPGISRLVGVRFDDASGDGAAGEVPASPADDARTDGP